MIIKFCIRTSSKIEIFSKPSTANFQASSIAYVFHSNIWSKERKQKVGDKRVFIVHVILPLDFYVLKIGAIVQYNRQDFVHEKF